jgi:hypothetical protein
MVGFSGHGGGERGCYRCLVLERLPTTTLVFEIQKCAPGHKSSKEHLAVICCGNASRNHKLKLVVIRKGKKP